MSAFTPALPDGSTIATPAPEDNLDRLVEVVSNEGLRANWDIPCGVYRCGEGRVSSWILVRLLTPDPDEDAMVLLAAASPDPVTA